MNKNLEQTIDYYCSNEIETFKQSEYYTHLCYLAHKLNFKLSCSFGSITASDKKIYFDFSVKNTNNEIVFVDGLDYEHLCDATCIIEIDKKDRYKFYSWEKDDDFIDSVKWVIKELEIKCKDLTY